MGRPNPAAAVIAATTPVPTPADKSRDEQRKQREATRQALRRHREDGTDPPLQLTQEEQALAGEAIESFVNVLGGKDKLVEALVVATDVKEVNDVAILLLDPRYEGLDLRRICAMANLTVADLFQAYKKAVIVRAHLQAVTLVAENLLPVVKDVMQRAAPFEVPCYLCQGAMEIPDPDRDKPKDGEEPVLVTCPQCRGVGKLLQMPDLDRQKLALELGQLVQKTGGLNILQQNVTVPDGEGGRGKLAAAGPGALEALQQVVGDLLSRPPVLDADVVEVPLGAPETSSGTIESSAVPDRSQPTSSDPIGPMVPSGSG